MRSGAVGKEFGDENAYVKVAFGFCVVGKVGRSGHAGWCTGRGCTECAFRCGSVIDSERVYMVLDVR